VNKVDKNSLLINKNPLVREFGIAEYTVTAETSCGKSKSESFTKCWDHPTKPVETKNPQSEFLTIFSLKPQETHSFSLAWHTTHADEKGTKYKVVEYSYVGRGDCWVEKVGENKQLFYTKEGEIGEDFSTPQVLEVPI
jgi:hypothetical protein